jgi:arginyl-tRNA synthetase
VTPAQLSRAVVDAVRCTARSGELSLPTADGFGLPQRVVVESPPRRGEGDYSVSVAFQVAKAAGVAPQKVARVLAARLAVLDGVGDVQVTGGGFLSVTLEERARAALVEKLAGPCPGSRDRGQVGVSGALAAAPAGGRPARACPAPADAPATDIARWSAATGDAPASLAVRTSRSSPLFHVQYAHARTRALARNALDLGFAGDAYACQDAGSADSGSDEPVRHGAGGTAPVVAAPAAPRQRPFSVPSARALLALLADHERISEQAVPARQARHLVAVGDAFFDFHDRCPPLPRGDEKPGAAHRARMALVEATGTVLAGGLTRLGVTAPDHL